MPLRRLTFALLVVFAIACGQPQDARRINPTPGNATMHPVSDEHPFATPAPSAPEWTYKPEPAHAPTVGSNSGVHVSDKGSGWKMARPPGTPAVLFPADRTSDRSRARESALDDLPTGFFTVAVPQRMTVGQDVKARAQVSAIRQALIDAWKGAGIAQPEELKISEEMSVRLVCSPQAFQVMPEGERWQGVTGDTTTWDWNVTPLKSGSYVLSFIFSVRLPNRLPHDRESHDERIEVAVAPGPPPTPTPTPVPFYRTVLSGVGTKLKENIVLAIVGLITAVAVGLRKKLIELVKSRWE